MVRIKNTFEHVMVKVPPKSYEPTKEERQSHEATHCPFRAWCKICVKAKSPDGKHAKQVVNPEHIPVIDFDHAFATDTLGGPKISTMVAIDSIHGSIFAVVTRIKGGQDDCVMQSFQNYIDRLGLVKAEFKYDQEPSTLDVANALIKRCQPTTLIVTATPKGSKGSFVCGERANLIIHGQLRAFREAVSMKYKTEVGSCVDGLDGTTLCMGCEQLSSEGNRENALSSHPKQGLHWRSCVIWRRCAGGETILRMEPI